ncbi:hypothetical protein LLEC1_06872 [Akanthomyces lecanii]|uniref:Uncharacterized protein n=1 Tax=Cordyceps confragosa TaxID=2714763 RepID=A0A179IFW1_CORDF|nr:hypothetical protein LLEC1_06872 [Akanthomyces lecanii]
MLLVTLALYHRDSLSHGSSRRIFGYEAYHWGLLFTPTSAIPAAAAAPLYSFDATDASDIDPVTFRLGNPSMDWWLRAETRPAPNPKLLGQLIVGTLPSDDDNLAGGDGGWFGRLEAVLEEVPLPEKNTHPQQSCVTWAVAAVGRMQAQGWVPAFDLQVFKDAALAYADARLKEDAAEPALKEYRAEERL